jgi:AraC-like DNA-binding protein
MSSFWIFEQDNPVNSLPPPTFDFWTLLFSGFSFIGLFYAAKLLITKRNDGHSWVLGIYLLLQSVTILEYVFYWTHLISRFPALAEFSLLFPLLYGPLLLLYLDRSFGNDKALRNYAPHMVPFVILLGFKLPFYFAHSNLKLFHTHDILFGKYFDYYPFLMLIHLACYGVVLMIAVKQQSGVGSMRLWAKWLVGFFMCYVALTSLYYLLSATRMLTPLTDYFISLATCGTIFLVAWYGNGFLQIANGTSLKESLMESREREKSVSKHEMIIEAPSSRESYNLPESMEKYRQSGLPESLAGKLAEGLESLMVREKLYHQNDLRLETLAEKLNTSKHFVSQVINQHFKMNFFEYVNLKRVEEAKQLLRTTRREELNVIEVAYAVGFNNKGTFNSVFKKVTGSTPTEFRNKSRQLLDTRSN